MSLLLPDNIPRAIIVQRPSDPEPGRCICCDERCELLPLTDNSGLPTRAA